MNNGKSACQWWCTTKACTVPLIELELVRHSSLPVFQVQLCRLRHTVQCPLLFVGALLGHTTLRHFLRKSGINSRAAIIKAIAPEQFNPVLHRKCRSVTGHFPDPHIEHIWLFAQKTLLSCPLYKKNLPLSIAFCPEQSLFGTHSS